MKWCWKVSAALSVMVYGWAAYGATNFPASGARYDIDLMHQLDVHGKMKVQVVQTLSPGVGVQYGRVTNLINLTSYTWGPRGLTSDTTMARASFTLPKVYKINTLEIQNGENWQETGFFEVRSSVDGVSWVTNVPRKALTNSFSQLGLPGNVETFTATDARYIDLTVSGPVTTNNNNLYSDVVLGSFHVYAATNTPEPPMQDDDGFSIQNVVDPLVGWHGWDQDGNGNGMKRLKDFQPTSRILPVMDPSWVIMDLGAKHPVTILRPTFYGNDDGGAAWVTSSISLGLTTTSWTFVHGPAPLGTTTIVLNAAIPARYVMISNIVYGGGNRMIDELGVFSYSPPPAGSMILVK